MKQRRRVIKRAHPTSRIGGILESLRPSRLKAYWFSREGAMMALKVVGGGFGLFFLVLLYFAKDLPNPNQLQSKLGQTTRFYDRTGKTVLYEVHGDKNRTVVDFNQMPDVIKNATIAIEDKDFYHHGAFSTIGILRAAFVDLFHRNNGLQGGSTITQQMVKNAILTNKRTFSRKLEELVLSVEIEALYSKNDILKLYLNEIPYGTQAYGIQAAAKTYFGKDAKDLNLPESAMLAALPQAPTYYSPYGQHPDVLLDRQHIVLDQMAAQGYVTQEQADAAKWQLADLKKAIPPVPQYYANVTAPHFVQYVEEALDNKYGAKYVSEGGLQVITSLDINAQHMAEDAIKNHIGNVRALGGSNAAFTAADPKNGQILAMVGSYNFNDDKFGAVNVAESERQPGSSFKPIVYSAAWGKTSGSTWGPGSTIYDVPTDFGNYKPKNFSGSNYGVQSMRTALDGSLNIPAVKTLYLAGIPNAIDTAHNLGITTLTKPPNSYTLDLVLGSGEVKLADMVNAYESFANGGQHFAQAPVLKITDPKGKIVEDNSNLKSKKGLDAQVAYLMANVLSDNSSRAYIFGANSPLVIPGHTVGAKTGTTEHFNDAWTLGFTPSITAGVWAGNNDNRPMTEEAVNIGAPIWHEFMVKYLAGKPNEEFKRPDGIKSVTLDVNTGKLATPNSHQTRTDMFPSWYKPVTVEQSRSAKVDKVSGKLATACTPPLAIQTAFSNEMHAEIPANDPAYERWEAPVRALASRLGYTGGGALPTENDDKHSCSDSKPSIDLSSTPSGGGVYHIQAAVESGTFPAQKLEISLDNQIISTKELSGSTTYSFDYTMTTLGSHTLKGVVTDAGLYTAETTQTIDVTSVGGGDFKGLAPADNAVFTKPVNVPFVWTNQPGSTHYQLWLRRDSGAFNKTGPDTTSTSLSTTIVLPGVYSWYVKALDASNSPVAQSNALDFTVN